MKSFIHPNNGCKKERIKMKGSGRVGGQCILAGSSISPLFSCNSNKYEKHVLELLAFLILT